MFSLELPLSFGDALTAGLSFRHVLHELPLQLKGYHEFGLPSLEVTCICLFLEECHSPILLCFFLICSFTVFITPIKKYLLVHAIADSKLSLSSSMLFNLSPLKNQLAVAHFCPSLKMKSLKYKRHNTV